AEIEAGNVDPRTVIAVLTHDPKFDVPVLQVALPLEVAYIGAMGSLLNLTDRLERLREAGVSEEHLNRLHSPIGLDLGGRTPEETAVSIMAEVIQRHWGGTAEPRHSRDGRTRYDDVPELPENGPAYPNPRVRGYTGPAPARTAGAARRGRVRPEGVA